MKFYKRLNVNRFGRRMSVAFHNTAIAFHFTPPKGGV